jgi:hypothetical protein
MLSNENVENYSYAEKSFEFRGAPPTVVSGANDQFVALDHVDPLDERLASAVEVNPFRVGLFIDPKFLAAFVSIESKTPSFVNVDAPNVFGYSNVHAFGVNNDPSTLQPFLVACERSGSGRYGWSMNATDEQGQQGENQKPIHSDRLN